VGKTHLLGAIVHTALIRRPATSIVRISGKELVEDLVSAARSNDSAGFRCRYTSAELLAVDDLHVLAGKPVTQNEVAWLLTQALDGGGRVVCVAGCPLAAIPVLAAGIGKLPGAVLVEVRRPHGRSMRTIVAAAAAAIGLTLDRRTVASIAARSHGDVRQGAGALTRLRFEHRRGEARGWRR
jgi:chromosomal replication initiator protein